MVRSEEETRKRLGKKYDRIEKLLMKVADECDHSKDFVLSYVVEQVIEGLLELLGRRGYEIEHNVLVLNEE